MHTLMIDCECNLSSVNLKLLIRSSHQEVFLEKGVLKICCKFTGEHPCRSVISIKLFCSFIEITLRYGCSVNLLHIFRTHFTKNTFGWLLLTNLMTLSWSLLTVVFCFIFFENPSHGTIMILQLINFLF